MDESNTFTDISEYGEFGLIEHVSQRIKIHHPSTIKGVGDDAALLNYKDKLTVTSTDMFLEGVHFDLMYTPMHHLGYKAVVATISDIYAMNAIAEQLVMSFAVSQKFSMEMVDDLYKGVRAACEAYGVDLVGGDTSSSMSGLVMTGTAYGKADPEQITYRNGANQYDLICVTGDLGAPYMGLQVLEREKRVFMENPEMQPKLEGNDYILQKQLKPEARKDIIGKLANLNVKPSAMIDVSDGVASDLRHICHQSETGCKVYESKLPISNDAYHKGIEFGIDPTVAALNGGEEYQLLFTVSQDDYDIIRDMNDITFIGYIAHAQEGQKLITRSNNEYDLKAQGWDAFPERDEYQTGQNGQ